MDSESYSEKLENYMINAYFANNINDEKIFDNTIKKNKFELYNTENCIRNLKFNNQDCKELIQHRDMLQFKLDLIRKTHINYIFDKFYEFKKQAILKLIIETPSFLLFNDPNITSYIISSEFNDLAFKRYISVFL